MVEGSTIARSATWRTYSIATRTMSAGPTTPVAGSRWGTRSLRPERRPRHRRRHVSAQLVVRSRPPMEASLTPEEISIAAKLGYLECIESDTTVKQLDPELTPACVVFEMVTRNGAIAAGFDDVGKLREGWRADVIVYRSHACRPRRRCQVDHGRRTGASGRRGVTVVDT